MASVARLPASRAVSSAIMIGGRIVDVHASPKRWVIEVDGAYHAGRCRSDERRDRYLQRAGYRVLRFRVQQVVADLRRVFEAIVEQLG